MHFEHRIGKFTIFQISVELSTLALLRPFTQSTEDTMNTTKTTAYIEEQSIKRLLDGWGLQRDTCRWDELRACYAPGATMVTTWFDGLASDFVDASIRAATSDTLVQHFFGPSAIQINGERATAETRLILLVRAEIEGAEVDITCYGRFIDRLVLNDGEWRILARMPIYEKDSLAPLDSRRPPELDHARLNAYPSAFRHLAYLQEIGGATITTRIPPHNSDAQRALYAAAQDWLQG